MQSKNMQLEQKFLAAVGKTLLLIVEFNSQLVFII